MEWRRLLRVKGIDNMGYVAESAGWLVGWKQGHCISLYESRNYTSLSIFGALAFCMQCCTSNEEVGLHEARWVGEDHRDPRL